MESERLRSAEPEPAGLDSYERCLAERQEFIERGYRGKVVIHASEREWELTRQARLKYMLMPQQFDDTVLTDWWVFLEDIRTQSGRHRHQGGLVIFVVEGRGWTVVDGVREDWEAGDLLLLPIKPDGVEHQHFNADPSQGCKWLAFIYQPYWNSVAAEMTQVELSPDWLAAQGRR